MGGVVTAQAGRGIGEATVAFRPRVRVAQAVGSFQGDLLEGGPLVPATAAVEE